MPRVTQAYEPSTCTVMIKFGFRAKPKNFALESSQECIALCELLSELLDEIDRAEAEGESPSLRMTPFAAPPSVQVPDVEDEMFMPGAAMPTTNSDHAQASSNGSGSGKLTPHQQSLGLLMQLDEMEPVDMWRVAWMRVLSGWCCRKHALEAMLFGVLMPLATAGYWLSDASGLESATAGVDIDGNDRWLPAICSMQAMLLVSRQVYHHGKYADAKDVRYQEGRVFRLEPAFNTSVTLYEPHPDERVAWPPSWWALTLTSAAVTHRPHCDGQVMQTEQETRRQCADIRGWMDPRYLHLNWSSQPCFVDRSHRCVP